MSAVLDTRLARLQAELDEHARVARYLHLDLGRPVRSLADGYPENAIALTGKITERLLKQLWIHHGAPGTPDGKTLRDLISGCRPWIRSHRVIDALHEIQRLRNRSSHDGYPIADEDGLVAIRRLLDVLAWYTSTGSGALSQHAPRLSPAAAAKAEFLAGLYVTLDFRLARRAELSQHTAYQLWIRERGLRTEHVELLLSRGAAEVTRDLAAAGGTLLRSGLPGLTRFLVLDKTTTAASCPPRCAITARCWPTTTSWTCSPTAAVTQPTWRDCTRRWTPRPCRIEGDLLAAGEQSGEMEVSSAGDARELLARLAAGGGNMLIVGRPGSGKTTLLKQLVAAPAATGARRYRFFFDLSLKRREESFADFVTRTPGPVHARGGRVRVPGVLLLHPRRVGADRPGRLRRGRARADPGRAARPVHRDRPGTVRGISRGDDLPGVVPGGLPAGAAAAGWHQPDLGEDWPSNCTPGESTRGACPGSRCCACATTRPAGRCSPGSSGAGPPLPR